MAYATQDLLPWATESVLFASTGTAATETVTNCGVSPVSAKEAAKSNGVYVNGDIRIEVSTSAPAFTLKPRDTAVWNGTIYTIMDATREPWLEFVQVTARNPAIAYDLRQSATVYRPAAESDSASMRIPNFAALYTAVDCRLQPVNREQEWDTVGGEKTRQTFTIYFGSSVTLKAGDIVEVDSVRYEVKSQTVIESLAELCSATCDRID